MLTDRERGMAALTRLEPSNSEIAAQPLISPATAKNHVSRYMFKLGAHDRAQLVVFA
ncbi:MAG: helix-turn-helix transcriptional regulator [Tepidiformaceae bacterium]